MKDSASHIVEARQQRKDSRGKAEMADRLLGITRAEVVWKPSISAWMDE